MSGRDKVERYIMAFESRASSLSGCRECGITNNEMKVLLGTSFGLVKVELCFYISSVKVSVKHTRSVPERLRKSVAKGLAYLNRFIDPTMVYGLTDKQEILTFYADYQLRKRNPADDHELDGFLTLIFKTAPERLAKIAVKIGQYELVDAI